MSNGVIMRLCLTAWLAACLALGVLLLPGDWRGLAVLPLFATWAVWTLPAAHGAHADTGGLRLVASPQPEPAGSMLLDYDRPAWEAHRLAELEAQAGQELWPGGAKTAVLGLDAGGWVSGPCLPGPQPPYVANGYKNPGAGMVAGESPARAVEPPDETPAPASPAGRPTTPLASGPPDPDPFTLALAADVAAYQRDLASRTAAIIAELRDDAATYLLKLREAL